MIMPTEPSGKSMVAIWLVPGFIATIVASTVGFLIDEREAENGEIG